MITRVSKLLTGFYILLLIILFVLLHRWSSYDNRILVSRSRGRWSGMKVPLSNVVEAAPAKEHEVKKPSTEVVKGPSDQPSNELKALDQVTMDRRWRELLDMIKKEPIVFNIDYWEQTGNALNSLFDLQCWAKSVGVEKVLQPTVKQHHQTSLFFVGNGSQDYFQFSDLFDIDHWNSMSSKLNYSRLVSLDYFYNYAIKEVVVIQMRYLRRGYSCRTLKALYNEYGWFGYLVKRGFQFVRTVCIDFNREPTHFITLEAFNDLIFDKFDPRKVTILFDEWRGIRSKIETTKRVDLSTKSRCSECLKQLTTGHFVTTNESVPENITYSPSNSIFPIVPSRRLNIFLDRFMDQYNLTGTRYIAVMVRTQKMKGYLVPSNSNQAFRAILSDWRDLKAEYNLSRTLYFTDVEKHGSLMWQNNTLATNFSENLYKLLGVNFTPNQMDSALEAITGSEDSVQIALLQRLIVARATCVVLAGGGTFQLQTLNRYLISHKGHECYRYRLSPGFSHSYARTIRGV